jgi:outer membrane biosynthesis protein TonB
MILLSLALHLAVILICSNTGIFRPALHEATPYYVDIVSLPALEPAPATAESQPVSAPTPPAPAPPASPPAKPVMTLPAKTAVPVKTAVPAKTAPVAAPSQDAQEQEAREFAQRMNRLEYNAEARHQAEALTALQKRMAGKKGAGPPTATGSDKGSDYGAYIQSRLKDALAMNLVYRSRAPEAAVHLYIDKKGKLVRYVMERPSADKLFNDSVIRTIEKAKANFPPTPTAAGFDKLYVFSPQEVTK